NYADRARVRSLLGKCLDLIDDNLGLGPVDLALLAFAGRDVDVYERRIQSLLGCWNAERQQPFGIELRREADDRLGAAEVLLEHQPVTRKHRTHQVIYALTRLEEIL